MLKMRVYEKLGKTVMPCPMRRVRGTREEKQSLHLRYINCQVTKKRIDRKVKVFYFFCQTKAKPNKARVGDVGVRQQKALILEVKDKMKNETFGSLLKDWIQVCSWVIFLKIHHGQKPPQIDRSKATF